ncbi:hypothetical protein OZX57_00475 [Bifidobacterium sp. ESL0682]|uniref:hypothetical protein n=1 Tax=Bifidobacterium sp. ESL0682 TaxID=2983212 RepID=UPI0023F6563F|nr:hypothetical protein [Bifidobacterium sp. ESL0682]WEV42039.1 hypothetical protein OZX57_00475 [Bifidobacterium sp. ESL0682]
MRREELRSGNHQLLRRLPRRKSFLFRALIIIAVIAVVVVALVLSLRTFKHNTKGALTDDSEVTTVQGKTKAPETDANQMKQGIEQQAGTCAGGWIDVDVSGQLPGANAASFCKTTQVAFITFQTKAAASMDGDMVRSQAANVISSMAAARLIPTICVCSAMTCGWPSATPRR